MHRILSRFFYWCHTSILSVRGGGSNQNRQEKFHLPSNHIEGNLLKNNNKVIKDIKLKKIVAMVLYFCYDRPVSNFDRIKSALDESFLPGE